MTQIFDNEVPDGRQMESGGVRGYQPVIYSALSSTEIRRRAVEVLLRNQAGEEIWSFDGLEDKAIWGPMLVRSPGEAVQVATTELQRRKNL